jgi:hypothetical protein
LVADSQSFLARWRKHFFQLFSVHGLSNVKRQAEINTTEPLVSEPGASEVEMAIGKLKGHKSLGTDQIPAELIKPGVTTICSEIHKLLNSIWNKDELPEEWKCLSIRRAIKQTVLIIEAYHYCQLTKNVIQHSPVKVNSVCRRNYWG